MKEKKVQKRYNEEFKRQAVELLIHSGKRQAQVARELGVSDCTLTLWKRAYLGQLKPGELEGKPLSPEEMLETIRHSGRFLRAWLWPIYTKRTSRRSHT